jgi:hypothetical protein
VDVAASAGYQTALKDWSYSGAAAVQVLRRTRVGLGYHYGVDPNTPSRSLARTVNSVRILLGNTDYFDYGRVERMQGWVEQNVRRVPMTIRVGGRSEQYHIVTKHTNYDLVADKDPMRPNPPVDPWKLHSATLTLTIGDDFDAAGLVGGNRLMLDAEVADEGLLGSEVSFRRVKVIGDVRLKTFLRRRLIPPTLDVRLTAGTSGGRLPFQRLMGLDGSLSGDILNLTGYGRLRTRRNRPYLGDRFAGAFWEHSFRGVPFELLGLYDLAYRGYNVMLHGGHGRVWIGDAHAADPRYAGLASDSWHHELGVSLSGIFGLLRLDATWRLDAPGFSLGVTTARLF